MRPVRSPARVNEGIHHTHRTTAMLRHRTFRATLLLVPLALASVLAGCGSDSIATPLAAADTAADDQGLVTRGEYIVRIGGCNDCHTEAYAARGGDVPRDEWLRGSALGYHGPWGTTYATNLRLTVEGLDEAQWLAYTGSLHTRPIMPDFMLRGMHEADRRAIYHFIRSLGPAGEAAPAALPPGQTPPMPYFQLVAPPADAPHPERQQAAGARQGQGPIR